MHHRVRQDLCFQSIDQRLQLHTTNAHPLSQCRAGQLHPSAPKNVFLTVQRQVVAVFGHQHLGKPAVGIPLSMICAGTGA
jgi:hypothetical protein